MGGAGSDQLHEPGQLNDQYRTLQASGAGSVLDLRNVTSVTNGSRTQHESDHPGARRRTVNLAGLTQITDPTTGDQVLPRINVTADGAGSIVNLSALTSFQDNYAGTNSDHASRH